MGRSHLAKTVRHVGFFQIDSVNVLARAHYLPLYSRRGPYDLDVLHRAAGRAPRLMFEYWAHEAAYVDIELWSAFQFRMREARRIGSDTAALARDKPHFVDQVLRAVSDRGPVTARQLETETSRRRDHWGWNWSETKIALEYLFYRGIITSARRNGAFERVYDLSERVIPAATFNKPALSSAEAHRVLVQHAVRALGVAAESSIRDYFRLDVAPTRRAIEELRESGAIEAVAVQSWKRQAFITTGTRIPGKINESTLISPFDPLIFHRPRAEELFDFRYRIEIYVPKEKRIHGYYVLPFLLGEQIVARVDLKANRATGALQVLAAFKEPGAPEHTASSLAIELVRMARWLDLTDVSTTDRGDFAPNLTQALKRVIG